MLRDKALFIPSLDPESAQLLASAFRACGVKADPMPPSDERTRDFRDRHTSGDECHPFQILAGDVMKLLESGEADPARSVFLLPSSSGACRFHRFVPDLRVILDGAGYTEAGIFSPKPNSPEDLTALGEGVLRTVWRALIAGGIARKLLLIHRPYELEKGAADKLYGAAIQELCATVKSGPLSALDEFTKIRSTLQCIRESFLALPLKRERSAPVIGIVGELFCRFNPLLNNDLIRQLEERGGQARLAGLTEEIRSFVSALPGATEELNLDERGYNGLFQNEFPGWGDPDSGDLLDAAKSYLPIEDGFTPIARRLGQIVHLAKQGVDCVLDVNPYPCMYGSACTTFYPKLSRDLDGLPIREMYFQGTKQDWSWLLDDSLAQARTYRSRKEGEKQHDPRATSAHKVGER